MAAMVQEFPSTVLHRNRNGMEALRKGDVQTAFDQFKEAESILTAHGSEIDGSSSLLAVTCNNLGLYYKKVGKLHGALSYLRRALKMEIEMDTDEVTLAGTHLNICAILSKLDKHDKAVQHALSALDLVNRRVEGQESGKVAPDDYSVLAIAYHNVAVERDFLQQFDKAADAFQRGHEVASTHLGADHPLAISLGNNCDAVRTKSSKLNRMPASARVPARGDMKDASGGTIRAVTALPPLGASRSAAAGAGDTMLPQSARASALRRDAADWAQNEESAFHSFAQTTLGKAPASDSTQRPQVPALPLLSMPSLGEPNGFKDIPFSTGAGKLVPVDLDGDGEPDLMMSIVEQDNIGHAVGKAKKANRDFRPSRMVKGSSRTARMTRRSAGAVNETTHRDAVVAKKHTSAVAQEAYARTLAASMIQRNWRAYYKYCQDNAEWLSVIQIAAIMIQKVWRSYHVRRLKQDAAAAKLQKVIRGKLCRSMLSKRQSAVAIQRISRGMLQRRKLAKWRAAGIVLTSLGRGGLARMRVRAKRRILTGHVVKIQSFVRMYMAQRRVSEMRAERNLQLARQRAATDIQRVWRGYQGRKRFNVTSNKYRQDMKRYNAATRIQAMMRRYWGTQRVEEKRAERLEEMNKAASHLRKMWLGGRTRKRYLELLEELAKKEPYVIVIQRHARGFLIRNRMWREAVRAEEELWGALEIQRCWRGYKGRVKWEEKLETVWLRETSAALIQRAVRGFLARQRVTRTKRRIARVEFERARLRFRSAQRIQAAARGLIVRRAFQRRFARALHAARTIQRIQRGHALRARLWEEVRYIRATMIQAAIRGYLVRRRRKVLQAKVICVQQAWRRYQRKPEYLKRQARASRQERKSKAAVIQKQFRAHKDREKVAELREEAYAATARLRGDA